MVSANSESHSAHGKRFGSPNKLTHFGEKKKITQGKENIVHSGKDLHLPYLMLIFQHLFLNEDGGYRRMWCLFKHYLYLHVQIPKAQSLGGVQTCIKQCQTNNYINILIIKHWLLKVFHRVVKKFNKEIIPEV